MSLAQASLVAALRKRNVNVQPQAWSVNQPQFDVGDAIDFVMGNAAEGVDVAIGAYVWHETHTQLLLDALKQNNFPGKIILGGPQISYTRNGLEGYYPQADVFNRGYGEDALAAWWLSHYESPGIAGVHYAGEPDMAFSADVDMHELPSPYLTGIISPQPFIRWETQRGCPFRCSFCQHRESDVSMTRRHFSESRILQEVQWILDNPVINDIAVLDPTFNSGPWYLTIIRKLAEGKYQGKIALQCRIEMVKDEFLEAVSELNRTAHVVLEFGLQTTNREEAARIQRPNNMRKVSRTLTKTYERNIATEVSLIFGLPGQTIATFAESIQFCKDHGVPTIYAYPLMLLRGTPLYEAKEELGLVESTDVDLNIDRIQGDIPHVIASPSFTHREWLVMAEMAEALDEYNSEQGGQLSRKTQGKNGASLNTSAFWHANNKKISKQKVSVNEAPRGGW